jgi:hypothetical protein
MEDVGQAMKKYVEGVVYTDFSTIFNIEMTTVNHG